jgi:hypothetical protein
MRRYSLLVAIALVAVAVAAYAGDFVTNPNNTLYPDKNERVGLPQGANSANYLRATDANAIKAALLDLRAALAAQSDAIAALGGGIAPGAVPTCNAFSPQSGPAGSTVVVTGANFAGVSSTTIGGITASRAVAQGGTSINITVPAGTSGGTIHIASPAGSADCSGTFTVTPTITAVAYTYKTINSGQTSSGWTVGITVGANSTDDLLWTCDDAASNTWPVQSGSTNANKPVCSLGAGACGIVDGTSCSGSSCSWTYHAPNCISTCAFRCRATSRQSTSDPQVGNYIPVTVNAGGAALAIAPTTTTVAPLGQVSFSASGGTSPYTWSLVSAPSGGAFVGGSGSPTLASGFPWASAAYDETSATSVGHNLTVTDAPVTCVARVVAAATNAVTPILVSSPSLTWTKRISTGGDPQNYAADIWTANVASNVNETVTLSWPGSAPGGNSKWLAVDCYHNVTLGAMAASAYFSAAPITSIITPQATGSMLLMVGRINSAGLGAATMRGDTTLDRHTYGTTYQSDNWSAHLTALTSTTSATIFGSSAPSTSAGMSAALELKGSSSGSVTGATVSYLAGASAGTDTVRVTDSAGSPAHVDATVTVTSGGGGGGGGGGSVDPSLAFPGCEGSGCKTLGGRGGTVYRVTNLNDSGPGSLRDCIQSTGGPRTCVFTVGGSIPISSALRVGSDYLTIAGQTAPGGGIEIRRANSNTSSYGIDLNGKSDIVIRYVKIRLGNPNTSAVEDYGQGIGDDGPSHRVVIDHCSVAWSPWSNIVFYPASGYDYNITVSRSLLAQPIYKAGQSLNRQGCTLNVGGGGSSSAVNSYNADIHHNVIAHADERNPICRMGSCRIVNNIVYNFDWYGSRMTGYSDAIGNYYKPGPAGAGATGNVISAWSADDGNYNWTGSPTFYVAGNAGPGNNYNPAGDQWSSLTSWCPHADGSCGSSAIAGGYQRTHALCDDRLLTSCQAPPAAAGTSAQTTPITVDVATTLVAAPTGSNFLATVGAAARVDCNGTWVANRDSLDALFVNDVVNGTGPSSAQFGWPIPGYSFPTLATGTPCTDAGGNGIPDAYEIAKCGAAGCGGANGAGVAPNSLTWLENYINGL